MTPEEQIINLYDFDSTWLDDRLSRLDVITDEDYQDMRDTINSYFRSNPPCAHEYQVVYFIAADHSTRFQHQCRHCFDKTTQIAKDSLSADEIRNAPERTKVDYAKVREYKNTLKDRMIARLNQARGEQRRDWYHRYLQSPQWQRKRQLVLKRANGICEGCGLNKATQVHHLTYERIGDEMLFDLVAVCDQCHDEVHDSEARGAA